jgi:hypothetical protein
VERERERAFWGAQKEEERWATEGKRKLIK